MIIYWSYFIHDFTTIIGTYNRLTFTPPSIMVVHE